LSPSPLLLTPGPAPNLRIRPLLCYNTRMIVRNIDDPIVRSTTYRAHWGGTARMVLTSEHLTSMEFFAWAALPAGNTIEEHVDAVEEIYFILRGGGLMKVGDRKRRSRRGTPFGSLPGSRTVYSTTRARTRSSSAWPPTRSNAGTRCRPTL
jgi:hypothetical protein